MTKNISLRCGAFLLPVLLALSPAFAGAETVDDPFAPIDPKKAATAAPAQPAATPAKLSAAEKADLDRIEKYLNELTSLSATFLQISDAGNFRHGTLTLQRPGKMRVSYDEPDKDFIIADGSMLHMWDDEVGQQTSVSLDSSLASFILRKDIKLSGDVVVTRFARYPAKIEVSLVSVKEPGEGELTLIFEDKPFKLRQWRVLDAAGHTTGVNLENLRENVEVPKENFVFVSPKLGKNVNSSLR